MEKTLAIIKPDAVRRHLVGSILARMEKDNFKISALRMVHLSRHQAEQFYAVHAQRPFFKELVETMCAGPVVVALLTAQDAVKRYRTLMGATDPKQADAGTLRKDFALSIGENSVHGSDSLENADKEISFFFAKMDSVG